MLVDTIGLGLGRCLVAAELDQLAILNLDLKLSLRLEPASRTGAHLRRFERAAGPALLRHRLAALLGRGGFLVLAGEQAIMANVGYETEPGVIVSMVKNNAVVD